MVGVPPAGLPPGLVGPNLTSLGPNRACTKENYLIKVGARCCAGTRSARCSSSSQCRFQMLNGFMAMKSYGQQKEGEDAG
ncbi:hypothetical protein F511_31420 [Dorcoceras hygrometricum]|uniref:Uncharacterized protein n=1 Tax=Dorcoceras hygrometricum TaxID=472368 RepID=A0A2Z7AMP3_9LAMI|nr:hypothetical protein F511_31420 [Dorcoceras hygrometricum]